MADHPMSGAGQILHGLTHALRFINDHAGNAVLLHLAVKEYNGNVLAVEHGDALIGKTVTEDDGSVNVAGEDVGQQIPAFDISADVHQQVVALFQAAGVDLLNETEIEGGGEIGQEKPDIVCFVAPHELGADVGDVVHFLRSFHNTPSHVLTDIGAAVECVGYRGGGYADITGDVLDGTHSDSSSCEIIPL